VFRGDQHRSDRPISGAAFLSRPWRKRPLHDLGGLRPRACLRTGEGRGGWCRLVGTGVDGLVHAWPPAPKLERPDRQYLLDGGRIVGRIPAPHRRPAGQVPNAEAIQRQPAHAQPARPCAITAFPSANCRILAPAPPATQDPMLLVVEHGHLQAAGIRLICLQHPSRISLYLSGASLKS